MNNTPAKGSTLIELLIALGILSIVALTSIPAAGALRDRAAVRSATTEMVSALALARSSGLAEARVVAVRFDSSADRSLVISPPDTLLDLPLGARYGIALSSTRDSIAYGPTGRGYGASNTTITIRRNGAADTIVVSRLGRVRR
jgi:type IV fimbrial biogenesis protein FimT